MARDVVYRPTAETDLDGIDDFIARDSPERAHAFVHRIRQRCEAIAEFPGTGRARGDLGPGLRCLPFERRVMIIFRVTSAIEIVRVFYGGQDYETVLREEPDA